LQALTLKKASKKLILKIFRFFLEKFLKFYF
jgi:hypothetical protein